MLFGQRSLLGTWFGLSWNTSVSSLIWKRRRSSYEFQPLQNSSLSFCRLHGVCLRCLREMLSCKEQIRWRNEVVKIEYLILPHPVLKDGWLIEGELNSSTLMHERNLVFLWEDRFYCSSQYIEAWHVTYLHLYDTWYWLHLAWSIFGPIFFIYRILNSD